jgi:hypothetical protein
MFPRSFCLVNDIDVVHSRTILILAVGILGIVSMSCYTGLVIYATFHDCDPVSTHVSTHKAWTASIHRRSSVLQIKIALHFCILSSLCTHVFVYVYLCVSVCACTCLCVIICVWGGMKIIQKLCMMPVPPSQNSITLLSTQFSVHARVCVYVYLCVSVCACTLMLAFMSEEVWR